jgi:penicillin amidase
MWQRRESACNTRLVSLQRHPLDHRWQGSTMRKASWLALLVVPLLAGCAALSPPARTTGERLDAFPRTGLALEAPVDVHWDEHQVPWIEARTDRDLAYTLGLVHMHLRETQLELLRHTAEGRLSELFGPPTADIDAALRTLDFGRVAERVVATMEPETRAWVRAFVAGLNDYRARRERRPPAFGLLGLDPAPWTPADLITIGRLAGTDVNWLTFFSLLEARLDREAWPRAWRRALAAGGTLDATGTSAPDGTQALLRRLLAGGSRSGSNALAIGPRRSASGHALMAADPHLGLGLPNLWLIAGMRSPSHHAVGLMIPGLPFIGVGRNPSLAWAGTNLRNAASDLYDVSGLPKASLRTRTERIGVRAWFDREVHIRESPLGPVLSDREVIPAREGEALALRWMGHEVSHEIGALLDAGRARDGEAFRRALADYGVSGQHMLYATTEGHIGHVLAARQPERAYEVPPALVLDASNPAHRWQGVRNALALPARRDPPRGFVASANERPGFSERPIGFFYGARDRVERLRAVAADGAPLTVERLQALQRDTASPAARRLAGALAERIRTAGAAQGHERLLATLVSWDGDYARDARGPVVFETLLNRIAKALYGPEPGTAAGWAHLQRFLLRDLDALTAAERRALLAEAVDGAAEDAADFPDWGAMHRLRIGHWLAGLPMLGRAFVLEELPVGGSRETLMKTAHDLAGDRHRASYGSQSRFVADLSDPDASWFVLLGGQDGWLGSEDFADQVPLWREGRYLRMPLTPEGVRERFPRRMRLEPAEADPNA